MTRPSIAAVLLLAAVTHAQPAATAPATRPDVSRRLQLLREQAGLPRRPIGPVKQCLAVRVDDGSLVIQTAQPADGIVAVAFSDWPGFATLTEQPRMQSLSFTHSALSENDRVETLTQVLTMPGRLQIYRGIESPTHIHEIELVQSRLPGDTDGVTLKITDRPGEEGGPPETPPQTFSAASFANLCREQPAAVRQHLLPILQDLGAADVIRGSDPARAWQALGPLLPPDPAIDARIDALFKRLAGDDFADRAKAEEELNAVGPAGAAELRRRDLSTFTPDVRAAAESALRQIEPMPADKAAELARSVPFLLDTLRLDEPKLSTAAAKQLASVTGKPLDLPADLSPAERTKRIDAYAAAVQPATQPNRTDGP